LEAVTLTFLKNFKLLCYMLARVLDTSSIVSYVHTDHLKDHLNCLKDFS